MIIEPLKRFVLQKFASPTTSVFFGIALAQGALQDTTI